MRVMVVMVCYVMCGMFMVCMECMDYKGLEVIIKWILPSLYRSYECKNSEK